MIHVDTHQYTAHHGHRPRQPRRTKTALWAFQIDEDPEPRYLRMGYKDAVRQAQAWAQRRVTVLP
jgi:hypothetical protein